MKHFQTFENFINEGKSQEWIVFLPIEKGDIIDIEDSLFGVYNDEEYDRIAPFNKVGNYTTSLSFPDMKTAQEWFKEYAVSHQNLTNQIIHYVCVPLIFFSVIGLLMSIPSSIIENTLELYNPLLENWAVFTSIFILIFYNYIY